MRYCLRHLSASFRLRYRPVFEAKAVNIKLHTFYTAAGGGQGFQSVDSDLTAAFRAGAIGALPDAVEGGPDVRDFAVKHFVYSGQCFVIGQINRPVSRGGFGRGGIGRPI